MTVKEAIQKMNEKILEIRLAAAEQRPLLNDDDKEKLDELVNKSIEVVKNAGNKIEATVNELAQDEKVDEFLKRVGDRCEEACNFTIDRIRSFGISEEGEKEETEAPSEAEETAEETEETAEEAPEEVPAEEICEETPVEETLEEVPAEEGEECAEKQEECCCCEEKPECECPCECENSEETEKEAEAEEEIREEVADLVEEAPEEIPVEETPVEETPVEETPVEETPAEECCCSKEADEKNAEETPVEAEETGEAPEENKPEEKEISPVDLFLMSDDVQSVVRTVKDVSTNVRKGFDDYYNRPETQEDIRRAKKAILDLAEKGMAALRKALADEDEQ